MVIAKKKDHNEIGSLFISQSIIFENKKILKKIPKKTGNKNFPLISFQKYFNPFFLILIIEFREKELMLWISSSYIFVINAIVPPDIPGIKSATPIIEPLRKRMNFLWKFFKVYKLKNKFTKWVFNKKLYK